MVKRAARRDETIKFFRHGSLLAFGDNHRSPVFSLCTTSGTFASFEKLCAPRVLFKQHSLRLSYLIFQDSNGSLAESEALSSNNVQFGFPLLSDPGSETHIQVLSEWTKSCENARHLPPDKNFVPTRLILVGDETSRKVQLVCNLGEKLTSVQYVALSHRWGTPEQRKPAEVKFATTTKDNINGIAEPASVDDTDLPKTFRDAIAVTRKLKVKYLWIDSLCVLQKANEEDTESKKDWDNESKIMEQIFSSAHLTIAASCAQHRFHGFLRPRTPRQFVTMTADDGTQFHVCEMIDNFDSDVEQGELNKRGWVLQERALSRRTIHFTETQTYWECGEGVRCETFTKTEK